MKRATTQSKQETNSKIHKSILSPAIEEKKSWVGVFQIKKKNAPTIWCICYIKRQCFKHMYD